MLKVIAAGATALALPSSSAQDPRPEGLPRTKGGRPGPSGFGPGGFLAPQLLKLADALNKAIGSPFGPGGPGGP